MRRPPLVAPRLRRLFLGDCHGLGDYTAGPCQLRSFSQRGSTSSSPHSCSTPSSRRTPQ
jgi:hypothetical protein